MEVVLNQFIGYSLKAPDGYVGNICDFYFDTHSWTIRYLVVDTGNWIQNEVLVSPLSLLEPDVATKTFPVKTTKKRIKVSHKNEHPILRHAQYPSLFKRTQLMTGCVIKAADTVLGNVFDYVIEDETWKIRYVIIKVEKSISTKQLLMDSRYLGNIYWSAGQIELNL
jgi:hypothetical protein